MFLQYMYYKIYSLKIKVISNYIKQKNNHPNPKCICFHVLPKTDTDSSPFLALWPAEQIFEPFLPTDV